MNISAILKAGAAWWAVLIFPVLFALPWVLPAFVAALRFVLESLSSFGGA